MRLLNLWIANTGNGDIKADDFEAPFTVALGQGARVLSGPTIGNRNPPDLQPRVDVKNGELVIAPLLLNGSRSSSGGQGDAFEVTALVSDLSAGETVRARIAGVPGLINVASSTSRATRTPEYSHVRVWLSGVLAVATLAVWATWLSVGHKTAKTHSLVTLATGGTLCAEVLRVDTTTIVLKLKDTGVLRTLPVKGTRAIKDDAC